MKVFNKSDLNKLYRPSKDSTGEQNGQITIIGGSNLFHGAPIMSLKVASRVVDMVYFATPEKSVGHIAESIKSKLMSFIWIPWEDLDSYVEKSDAVLIGPGFMRYKSEQTTKNIEHRKTLDEAGEQTYEITKRLLKKFPRKKWVVDAGSLQVIEPEDLPKDCIITPNKREFEILFGKMIPNQAAKKYNCIITYKIPKTLVCSKDKCVEIGGGNAGLTKGGTGDVLAGLTVALLAKNDPFLAASAASYLTKNTAGELYKRVGTNYNSDDLADKIPEILKKFLQ